MTIADIAPVARPRARPGLWARLPVARVFGFALIAALLVLWELSARLRWIVSDSWPAITDVFRAMATGLASGELIVVLGSTLARALAGYACGVAAGIVLGLAFALSPWTRRTLSPLVELLRPIPVPAIVPPLVLFLGVNDAMKITVVALTAVFPVLTNMVQGVLAVDDTLIGVARTFHVGRIATIRKIVFPASLPYLLAGMRIALSLALIVAVVAEMIAGNQGVGHYLVLMQYAIQPQNMYAAIFLLAVAGYLINRLFVSAEKRFIPWYAQRDTSSALT